MSTVEQHIHTTEVRAEILSIMNQVRFLDMSAHSSLTAQSTIHSLASGVFGPDVARIAADRVIDCLMYL